MQYEEGKVSDWRFPSSVGELNNDFSYLYNTECFGLLHLAKNSTQHQLQRITELRAHLWDKQRNQAADICGRELWSLGIQQLWHDLHDVVYSTVPYITHDTTMENTDRVSSPFNAGLYTHTRLTALFPGLPRWAGTRKVKPIWILLKQETVSGSGISWAICKSAPWSRQTTTPAPHHSVFTGRMPFLPPNQQCQSTEGTIKYSDWQIGDSADVLCL